MAPYPEELDVFTVPHSRMKELIHDYCDLLSHTNFSSGHEVGNLLHNLHNTFSEFKCHEQIENRYIMAQLRSKLDALSIQNQAVCNCHKDNRLTEMMNMFRDGYYLMDKTMRERVNYGLQLKEALEDFTKDFVPHMKEEEEVFQPLLMKYFSYEELQDLRRKVMKEHARSWNEEKYTCDEKEDISRTHESEKSCEKEAVQEQTSVLDLPPEITLKIFSHLNPKDLCRCAQVCHSWSEVAMDGKLWQEVSPVRWAQGDWRFRVNEEQDDEADDDADDEDEEAGYVCLDEDRDIDESESSDEYSDNENENISLLKRESKILHSLAKYILPKAGWGVEKLNLANSKALTNALLYKMLSHCPNIEHLILTQTTIADSAFKGLFKHAACSQLKTLILSGCANITDVSLIRIANATRQDIASRRLKDAIEVFEDANKKDDIVHDGRKEFWTNSESDEADSEDSGVVVEKVADVLEKDVKEKNTGHEDANCCRFGCGCRVGLNLGTRLKFNKTTSVDWKEFGADVVASSRRDDDDLGILRKSPPEVMGDDFGEDPDITGDSDGNLSSLEQEFPDDGTRPPDGPLVDLEECAADFVWQSDGELRRTSNCNDPRCFKFDRATERKVDDKWIKITIDDPITEKFPMNAAGDRDKISQNFGNEVESVQDHDGDASSNDVDENGNGPGALSGTSRAVLGGRPPDNCDGMRGAIEGDRVGGEVVMFDKHGALGYTPCAEGGAEPESCDQAPSDPGEASVNVTVAMDGDICCKVMEELKAPQYAKQNPAAPSGGHGEIQESVSALLEDPYTQPSPRVYNRDDPSKVQSTIETGPRVLKPERLFSDEKLKRTFDRDPFTLDLSFDFETRMERIPRALEHLNLSGCFRITDVGLRSLGEDGGLPSLRFLDLSGCSNISAAGLSDLVQGCPNLEYEKFYYCDNITDGPLATLANGCQNMSCSKRVCCRSGFYLYN